VSKRGLNYEQERLLLYMQERMAEAIEASGLKRSEVARLLGVSRPYVTQLINRGYNLTLKGAASVLHATGHRLVLKLERIDPDDTAPPPSQHGKG
jgi:predicted XRE-type DNA-binding protein